MTYSFKFLSTSIIKAIVSTLKPFSYLELHTMQDAKSSL